MIPHARQDFIFPNRLTKSVGFLVDVLLLQRALKRLVWWQPRLVQLLEILEPLVRSVKFLLLYLVDVEKLCLVKAWCNVVFNVQKFQLGGCQERETLALQK